MKVQLLGLVALLACSSAFYVFSNVNKTRKVPARVVEKYAQWKQTHRKLYASPSESDFRLRVFEEKLTMVEEANAQYDAFLSRNNEPALDTPMFELKRYSDLTTEEFKKRYTGLDISKMSNKPIEQEVPAPTEAKKASLLGQSFTIPIRHQLECGSCWAFSVIATIEKQYYDINRQVVHLSHQELVDCSEEDHGCDGGWPLITYSYVQQYGISTAKAYPYIAQQNNCGRDEVKRLYLGKSFAPREVAFTLKNAQNLANQGVIAGLSVYSSGKFSHLAGGNSVYDISNDKECKQQVDHAVNLGGAGADFVIVLNSWGTEWGDKGMKKIKPCSDKSLWGTPNVMSHTYANI